MHHEIRVVINQTTFYKIHDMCVENIESMMNLNINHQFWYVCFKNACFSLYNILLKNINVLNSYKNLIGKAQFLFT